jgi:two-component system alkaline phosphatase synthesis response regulator PhoP
VKSRIAYIDDNISNLDCIKLIFEHQFDVDTFHQPETFLTGFNSVSPYAAIMVDIHMPTIDGFSLYEQIVQHANYNGCPILFISGDETDAIRIKSLSLGAVDFLNRHMKADEMMARVNSKIQFFKKLRSIVEFGNLKVNLTLLKTYLDQKEMGLTFLEFKILWQLISGYPEILPKEQIIEHVWGSGKVLDATIYTHISNLNGKLGKWDHEVIGIKNRGFKVSKKESAV